jgi:hypothetical protein
MLDRAVPFTRPRVALKMPDLLLHRQRRHWSRAVPMTSESRLASTSCAFCMTRPASGRVSAHIVAVDAARYRDPTHYLFFFYRPNSQTLTICPYGPLPPIFVRSCLFTLHPSNSLYFPPATPTPTRAPNQRPKNTHQRPPSNHVQHHPNPQMSPNHHRPPPQRIKHHLPAQHRVRCQHMPDIAHANTK